MRFGSTPIVGELDADVVRRSFEQHAAELLRCRAAPRAAPRGGGGAQVNYTFVFTRG